MGSGGSGGSGSSGGADVNRRGGSSWSWSWLDVRVKSSSRWSHIGVGRAAWLDIRIWNNRA